ncbi:hypothetical protein, partial [Acinetobacter baumannii]|uniref:hypothetical protein n=1 Tax=Acinetobacter baumannii TaxID=470 RepID=UPI003CC79F20
VPAYGPQNDVTLKMPAFEWVHVQLHQQKGMISLSPPTICNSALCSKRLFRIFRLFILNILFTLWWRCRNWTLQDAWSCMGDVQKEFDSKLF